MRFGSGSAVQLLASTECAGKKLTLEKKVFISSDRVLLSSPNASLSSVYSINLDFLFIGKAILFYFKSI